MTFQGIVRAASAALLAIASTSATPLFGQVAVNADLATNSAYMWRGTTMTNQLVLQPDLIVSASRRGWSLQVGANANLEPARYDNPLHDISERGGTSAGVAEVDVWAEATRPIGIAQVTLGGLSYSFPNAAGLTAAQNTFEVYARAAFDAPLAPTVQVWLDTWRVNGAYAELSIARDVTVGRVPLHLSALQGINISQNYSALTNEGYFERPGFTHTDLAVSTAMTMGAVNATPSLHVILTSDAKTRAMAPGRELSAKLWLGVSLGWAHRFREPGVAGAARPVPAAVVAGAGASGTR